MQHLQKMRHDLVEKFLVVVLGIMGGGIKFTTMQIQAIRELTFWQKAGPSIATAMLCALGGLIIKDIYNWAKKKIKRK